MSSEQEETEASYLIAGVFGGVMGVGAFVLTYLTFAAGLLVKGAPFDAVNPVNNFARGDVANWKISSYFLYDSFLTDIEVTTDTQQVTLSITELFDYILRGFDTTVFTIVTVGFLIYGGYWFTRFRSSFFQGEWKRIALSAGRMSAQYALAVTPLVLLAQAPGEFGVIDQSSGTSLPEVLVLGAGVVIGIKILQRLANRRAKQLRFERAMDDSNSRNYVDEDAAKRGALVAIGFTPILLITSTTTVYSNAETTLGPELVNLLMFGGAFAVVFGAIGGIIANRHRW